MALHRAKKKLNKEWGFNISNWMVVLVVDVIPKLRREEPSWICMSSIATGSEIVRVNLRVKQRCQDERAL